MHEQDERAVSCLRPHLQSHLRVALTDIVNENKPMVGLNIAQIMFEVSRRMARGSSAWVELALRLMRLLAELGLQENLDTLVKIILSDAYSDAELCSQILHLKRILEKYQL